MMKGKDIPMKENAIHDERKWFFTMKGQSMMERSKGNGEQDGGEKSLEPFRRTVRDKR